MNEFSLKVVKQLGELANHLDQSGNHTLADLIDLAIVKIAEPTTYQDSQGVLWTKLSPAQIQNEMIRRQVELEYFTAWKNPQGLMVVVHPGMYPDSKFKEVPINNPPPTPVEQPKEEPAEEESGLMDPITRWFQKNLVEPVWGKKESDKENEADDQIPTETVIAAFTKLLSKAKFSTEKTSDGDIIAKRGSEKIVIQSFGDGNPSETETFWNKIHKESEEPDPDLPF